MTARSLLSPRFWYDNAREQCLVRMLKPLPTPALSWTLNSNLLSTAKLIWPRKYGWPDAAKTMDQIRAGLSMHLPIRYSDSVTQACARHVVQVLLEVQGKEHLIAIDYSDYSDIDTKAAKDASCYFKMQFREQGYELEQVVAGGFVSNDPSVYRYANALRQQEPLRELVVYGRFSAKFGTAVREKAIGILENQNRVPFRGGLERIRYSRYLEEAYRSQLCLDLPGNGALCYRLIDYLALGCAIVSPQQRNRLHVPLEADKHILYCKSDFSDLLDVCERALADPQRLQELRLNARAYFDQYLHQQQLAAYYLHTCFNRI